jgi:hypothetical protein
MASSKDNVAWSYDAWRGLRGGRIVMQARKLSDHHLIRGSHTHKAQQVVGSVNAEAWIEIPLRAVAEKKPG